MTINELAQFAADLYNSFEEYEALGHMEEALTCLRDFDAIVEEIAAKANITKWQAGFMVEELL